MPQLQQTVSFSHEDITKMLHEKAKEQIKEATGKDPTGSSSITMKAKEGEGLPTNVEATVNFNCNGKR